MNDLRDLYQEVILDHSSRPRNHREMTCASHEAKGHNPLCGDQLTLYLTVEEGVVTDVSFRGNGCAISTASASMLTDAVRGKTVDETRALFEKFHDLLTGEGDQTVSDVGKLAVFAGVREFPVRVKCATLAWHTLKAALDAKSDAGSGKVTTE